MHIVIAVLIGAVGVAIAHIDKPCTKLWVIQELC